MDEDERQKKLEAGKAKLANFRKKRSSTTKTKKRESSLFMIPTTNTEIHVRDSTEECIDDRSAMMCSHADRGDHSSTAADELSTEEDLSLSLTAVERIQELESASSDLQIALQNLTSENKELKNKILVHTTKVEVEKNTELMQARLNQYELQISTLKKEHETTLQEEKRKVKEMEQRLKTTTHDSENVRTYREETAQTKVKLETAFRDIEKLKKDHQKEVSQLHQRLASNVDECEARLHEGKLLRQDLENKLKMADTVSSEIQTSLSKRLERLEEERINFCEQLKQSQLKEKEDSMFKKRSKDLEEEVLSCQAELAETNRRLEYSEKQSRQLQDDIDRCQDTIAQINNEKNFFEENCAQLDMFLKEKKQNCDELTEKLNKQEGTLKNLVEKHSKALDDQLIEREALINATKHGKSDVEDQMKLMRNQHAEELKNLHSQHHRQMNDLKCEMENEMDMVKASFEEKENEKLEVLKKDDEQARNLEISRLHEKQSNLVEKMLKDHRNEIAVTKERARKKQQLMEERLEIALKQNFDDVLENELSTLRKTLESEFEIAQMEEEERHRNGLVKLKEEHESYLIERLKNECEALQIIHAQALLAKQTEFEANLEMLKKEFGTSEEAMTIEHAKSLKYIENKTKEALKEKEKYLLEAHEKTEKNAAELKGVTENNEALQQEVTRMKMKMDNSIQELKKDYDMRLETCDAALLEERRRNDQEHKKDFEEIKLVKKELRVTQIDRDRILQQAEDSQKKLALLQQEEEESLQTEIDQMKSVYQEKIHSMQIEIDSLRASRSDLKSLRDQLRARNANVEEIERIRDECNDDRDRLIKEHEEELQNIRLKYEEELKSYQAENLQPPKRSLSPTSDNDIKITVHNEDFQNSEVLSQEDLEDEDEKARSLHEGNDNEQDHLEKLHVLQETIKEMEEQIKESNKHHKEVLDKLRAEHDVMLKTLFHTKEAEKTQALVNLEGKHNEAFKEVQQLHDETLEKLQEAHQSDLMKFKLQCEADATDQINNETTAIRTQMKSEHDVEIDSLKHRMEVEMTEKLEIERKKHIQTLERQAEELSSSLETRFAAVRAEIDEKKQEELQEVRSNHQDELNQLQEEMNHKLKAIMKREEETSHVLNANENELQKQIENITGDFERLKSDYKVLMESMENSKDQLRLMQSQHDDEMQKMIKRLREEHEGRQESALQKQASIFQQAQAEFMKLHEQQLARYTAVQREEAERKETEIEKRICNAKKNLVSEHETEKRKLSEAHKEELNKVTDKIVAMEEEKQKFEAIKHQLEIKLQRLQEEKEQELSDLKTTLVNQHVTKFQQVTANLEQLHKEEVGTLIQEHSEEESRLRAGLLSLQRKIDAMDGIDHEEEMIKIKQQLSMRYSQEELNAKLKETEENHQNEIKTIRDEHELHLQQIEEEIRKQDEEHQDSMQKILESQGREMDVLQKQFDAALTTTSEAGLLEAQKMAERIVELEAELQDADGIKSKMNGMQGRERELEAMLEEYRIKLQAWEEEKREQTEDYDEKLQNLSEALDAAREETKDLTSGIQFERAKYEGAMENLRNDARRKEDKISELQAVIEQMNSALESVQLQHKLLIDCRERETRENNNLLQLLREDLSGLKEERDKTKGANEKLIALLSELLRHNQQCEEMITWRLENLPLVGAGRESQLEEDLPPSRLRYVSTSKSKDHPLNASFSGSFLDEDLEMSQRLDESLFSASQMDSDTLEMFAETGAKVKQATEGILTMLESTMKQLNAAQQAQVMLSDELQKVIENQQSSSDNEAQTREDSQMELQQAKNCIAELEATVSEQNEAILKFDDVTKDLCKRENKLEKELEKFEEEKALLKKQRKALKDGRSSTELNLLRATEELSNEKQMLIECHQQERDRLENTAHQLERVMEQSARAQEDKETSYLTHIDDLNSQLEASRKQIESKNRFTAELTNDREFERDQFEKEMETMKHEVENARDAVRSETMLVEKLQRESVIAEGNIQMLGMLSATTAAHAVCWLATKAKKSVGESNVAHLEEDLDLKQQLHDETVEEIEKLKTRIEEKEQVIIELRERLSHDELENARSEAESLRVKLEESQRQHGILQEELYGNMLRISDLEAQLDRYRHGLDEDAITALERSVAEERILKEQAREELEAKENEIEQLVEQQNTLYTQLMEKEKQIEQLLASLENSQHSEADNASLKDKLKQLQAELSATSTQPQQLEALSNHLLVAKNAEIDELRQKIVHLTSGDEEQKSEKIPMSLEATNLVNENEKLKAQLLIIEKQLQDVLEKEAIILHDAKDECHKEELGSSCGDTGIHEVDLITPDLTPRGDVSKLHLLEEKNAYLQEQLEKIRKQAEDLITRVDVFNLPASTKEKIRDLEEILEKERNELSFSTSSQNDNAVNSKADAISFIINTEFIDGDGKDETVKPSVIQEKFNAIENDLKSLPMNILHHILNHKELMISNRDNRIVSLKNDLNEKIQVVEDSIQQIDKLNQELHERDAVIQVLKEEAKKKDGDINISNFDEKKNVEEFQKENSDISSEAGSSFVDEDVNLHQEEICSLHDEDDNVKEHVASQISDSSVKEEITGLANSSLFDSDHDKNIIDDEEEVNILLNMKEREIEELNYVVQEKERLIMQRDSQLAELTQSWSELESRLKLKCCEVEEELSNYKFSHPDDVLEYPMVQEKIQDITLQLEDSKRQTSIVREECNRMMKQLEDIQREYASLLNDNNKLAEEYERGKAELADHMNKLQQLEQVVQEREFQLKQAEQNIAASQNEVCKASEMVERMQVDIEGHANARHTLQSELDRLSEEHTRLLENTGPSTNLKVDGSGDWIRRSSNELDSLEVERLNEENHGLREEIKNLRCKTEKLESELEWMKQNNHLEATLHKSICDEPVVVDAEHEQNLLDMQMDKELTRLSSTDSASSTQGLEGKLEELKRNHRFKMEEMQNEYTCELEEAVAMAIKEQEKLHEEKLMMVEERHKREISEILSESISSDNELAHQLHAELDLADMLDKELIDQLKTAQVSAGAVPKPTEEDAKSSMSASPEQAAEISSRLQQLLSRLHNEGVQVLSLSELQFLQQHNDYTTSSIADEEEFVKKSPVNVEELKRAWKSEKTALLDAIQTLKELLTQSTSEAAQCSDDEEALKWRAGLLRSVADFFERERQASLAELQASVVEAKGDPEMNEEVDIISRLEAIEKRIKNEELKQRSDLERILGSDREQLMDDVKQLKVERKEELDKAYDRILRLQEEHKKAEETHYQLVGDLKYELEQVKSRLQREEAITSDLRASLDTEKEKLHDLLPALQRERQRTLELSTELSTMREKAANMDFFRTKLMTTEQKLKESEERVRALDKVMVQHDEEVESTRARNQRTISELQNVIGIEEQRRRDAVASAEKEHQHLARLRQDLTNEKNEVIQLTHRCQDLTLEAQAEREKCEKLRDALMQESERVNQAAEEVKQEQKITAATRDQNYAVVADLETSLENAKKEAEQLQTRAEDAEQEKKFALHRMEEEQAILNRKLEREKVSCNEAVNREKRKNSDLEINLEREKLRKQTAEQLVTELERKQQQLINGHAQLPSPSEEQDALLACRRQMESLRQKLQLETSKLQNLAGRESNRLLSGDPSNSLVPSDGEKIESVKCSLQEMQGELKQLHAGLTLPGTNKHQSYLHPAPFNDQLLKQNAELSDYTADAAKEARVLREEVAALKRDKRPIAEEETSAADSNAQKMANRMHRLYTRFVRAESFKKSLIYQKKYLLLLIGGFQECEDATLAFIARLGGHPSSDGSSKSQVTDRSSAYTRFRSVARVVIAVFRMKFLVRKWEHTHRSVSAAIQSKHGISVTATAVNGVNSNTSQHSEIFSQELYPLSRTPSPFYPEPTSHYISPTSTHRYLNRPSSTNRQNGYSYEQLPRDHGTSLPNRYKPSTSQYNTWSPKSSIHRTDSKSGSSSHTSTTATPRGRSPSAIPPNLSFDRSQAMASDLSLNDYIQRLENLQRVLRYPH